MSIRARREREKQQRRNAILSAAKELFWEKGYEATMDEIAERAELSKPTLYLYFQNKDDLYVSIVLDVFQELKGRFRKATEGKGGVEEKVRSIFSTFIDFNMEHRELFHITQYVITENARKNISDDLSEAINRETSELLGYGSNVIQEGINSGVIRDDVDPTIVAIICWRSATGLLDLATENGLIGSRSDIYTKLFDSAIALLVDGAKARR